MDMKKKEPKKIVTKSDSKRCPKCGSNKWEFAGQADSGVSQRDERGNIVFEYDAFAKYKCKKCNWEFSIERRGDRMFCAVEKGECYRCGSKQLDRLTEGDRALFKCKHCTALFIIDKETGLNSYI